MGYNPANPVDLQAVLDAMAQQRTQNPAPYPQPQPTYGTPTNSMEDVKIQFTGRDFIFEWFSTIADKEQVIAELAIKQDISDMHQPQTVSIFMGMSSSIPIGTMIFANGKLVRKSAPQMDEFGQPVDGWVYRYIVPLTQ